LGSIICSTKIKTYDIQFSSYIQHFHIIHEQFQTNDNKKLYLLSCENKSQLFEMNCLLTSPLNPLLSSSPYYSIENQIYCQLNKILLNIQLKAFLSIIQFKKHIQNKLNETKTNSSKVQQKSSSSSSSSNSNSSSFKIDFGLEEICVLIGNNYSQILYIQLKELNGYLTKTNIQILSHLVFNDFRVIDLHKKCLYPFIISKENKSDDLITFYFSLFNYSNKRHKPIKNKNSFIRGQIQRLNIIFLYKHMDLILSVINSFQTKQIQKEEDIPSNEPSFISSILQKYQKHSLQFHLDFILNCPQILIPVNSYSYELIIIDLGKLTMHTDSNNQNNSSFIEQHRITFENLSANRIILNNNNNLLNLFECSPFVTIIDRHLNSQNDENNNEISIKIQWDNIDFKLGKYDYAFINKILQENLNEKVFHKFPQTGNNNDQQDQNKQNNSSDYIPKKQSSTNEISLNIQLDLQIKQISLTLYLDETDLHQHQTSRDDSSKFICFTIQFIEAMFKQSSDSTCHGKFQVQHLFAEDLRQKKQNNNIQRFINKNFNVDENTPLVIINLQPKPDNQLYNRKGKVLFILTVPLIQQIEHDTI
jgi:hypothetical protein